MNASALTLLLARILAIKIGPLTANLSTMVFVLTLSHIIFITFNWKQITSTNEEGVGAKILKAIEITFTPSFWSMATTLVGFLSLLFAQATPLRQLGVSGAIGTLVAFLSAYGIYPWFLSYLPSRSHETVTSKNVLTKIGAFFSKPQHPMAWALIGFTVIISTGIWRINTDPSLFSYFKKEGELREGLEYIDRNGGSSPLKILIADRERKEFNTGEAYQRLWDLHTTLEKDPSVGNVVSLPILLAETKRLPLMAILANEWLLKLMETRAFGEIAKYFITEDRQKTLFLLRMRELGRTGSRDEVIARIKSTIEEKNFAPAFMGGVYMLQGKLAKLLASSLESGTALLIVLFVAMGWFLSRSIPICTALLISLCAIPMNMLGAIGYLGIPLDIISAPGANLAIGMGVDAMIHMMISFKRLRAIGQEAHEAWHGTSLKLWQPILTSAILVSVGFGIFLLSHFPPTQRFGFSVMSGSVLSASVSLFLLPWVAETLFRRKVRV